MVRDSFDLVKRAGMLSYFVPETVLRTFLCIISFLIAELPVISVPHMQTPRPPGRSETLHSLYPRGSQGHTIDIWGWEVFIGGNRLPIVL